MKINRRNFSKLLAATPLLSVLGVRAEPASAPVPSSAPVVPAPKLDNAKPFELDDKNWFDKMLQQIMAQMTSYRTGINDPITQRALTSDVQDIIQPLHARGLIHSYLVVCNAENNSPSVVDEHALHLNIAVQRTASPHSELYRFELNPSGTFVFAYAGHNPGWQTWRSLTFAPEA